jgi:hypothetical protein
MIYSFQVPATPPSQTYVCSGTRGTFFRPEKQCNVNTLKFNVAKADANEASDQLSFSNRWIYSSSTEL